MIIIDQNSTNNHNQSYVRYADIESLHRKLHVFLVFHFFRFGSNQN